MNKQTPFFSLSPLASYYFIVLNGSSRLHDEIPPLLLFFLSLSFLPADLSKAGMAEFQEKLRLQHETSMHKELEKLLATAKGAEQEVGLGFGARVPGACLWIQGGCFGGVRKFLGMLD